MFVTWQAEPTVLPLSPARASAVVQIGLDLSYYMVVLLL